MPQYLLKMPRPVYRAYKETKLCEILRRHGIDPTKRLVGAIDEWFEWHRVRRLQTKGGLF